MIIFAFIAFVLGCIGASFTHVLASRVYTGISPFRGRSHCFSCGGELSSKDLIPLVSFIRSKGRCRMCGTKVSVLHPLIELMAGLLCMGVYLIHGLSFLTFFYIIFILLMVFLSVYDIAHTVLPTKPLYASVLLGFLIALVTPSSLLITLIGTVCAAGFIYALHFFSKGKAMGFGDVVLTGALSLAVGIPASWIGLVLSFWIGAVISIAVLYLRFRTVRMGVVVPFGPFLVLGFLFAYVFEGPLVSYITYLFL